MKKTQLTAYTQKYISDNHFKGHIWQVCNILDKGLGL